MLEKIVEGRNTSYVVRMKKVVDDYPLFMDATRIIEDAIRRDKSMAKNGHYYEPENGPHYAIEHQRVIDYIDYVSDKLNRENYFKFDTSNYRFFFGSIPARQTQRNTFPLDEK